MLYQVVLSYATNTVEVRLVIEYAALADSALIASPEAG